MVSFTCSRSAEAFKEAACKESAIFLLKKRVKLLRFSDPAAMSEIPFLLKL
jgi:hypothetical protein